MGLNDGTFKELLKGYNDEQRNQVEFIARDRMVETGGRIRNQD